MSQRRDELGGGCRSVRVEAFRSESRAVVKVKVEQRLTSKSLLHPRITRRLAQIALQFGIVVTLVVVVVLLSHIEDWDGLDRLSWNRWSVLVLSSAHLPGRIGQVRPRFVSFRRDGARVTSSTFCTTRSSCC